MPLPECPNHPGFELTFVAWYAAPGIGYSASCPVDDEKWAVVDETAHKPEALMHVPPPEAWR